MCHNFKKTERIWRKNFRTDVAIYLKICDKFLEQVTRSKGVKDKKS